MLKKYHRWIKTWPLEARFNVTIFFCLISAIIGSHLPNKPWWSFWLGHAVMLLSGMVFSIFFKDFSRDLKIREHRKILKAYYNIEDHKSKIDFQISPKKVVQLTIRWDPAYGAQKSREAHEELVEGEEPLSD